MAFHVGQKVEYIGPNFATMVNLYKQITPVRDVTYTVRSLGSCMGEDAIRLCEVRNAPYEWSTGYHELWMNAKYFRPVTETKSKTSFTEGAPLDSEKWDNRRKVEVRV